MGRRLTGSPAGARVAVPALTAAIFGLWLAMLVAAVLNGLLRDTLLTPWLGESVSLPLSGIVLSAAVFTISWFGIVLLGTIKSHAYALIGLLWVAMTLIFEYAFGHYVAGRSWQQINEVFNLAEGNLFPMALLTALTAPWLSAKLQGRV